MPAKWKFKEVEALTKLVKESPVIAVASIESLPSKQMQEIRAKLHGQVTIKVVKNRLAKRAFEAAGIKGIKELEENVEGPTALIFSNENPFKLYQMFKSSRVNAPAKAGQKAPMDIIVPAGDTPFKPGPIIGDLQAVGIKAKIQGPIIAVVQASPVIKEGEEFSAQLANVLAQLEVNPMEIGINVRAALEAGMVYGKDVLDIDAEQTLSDLATGYQNALNLAVEIGYPTKESVKLMIIKAANNARNLAIDAEIYNGETVDYFLSKADREAKGLASAANYTPGAKAEAPKEEKKEEPKEEKKEEKKVEEAKVEEKVEEKVEKKEAPKEEKKEEAPAEKKKEEVKEEATEEKAAEEIVAEEKKEEAKEEAKEEKSDEAKEEEAIAEAVEAEQEEKAEEKLIEEADPLDQVPEIGEEAKKEESS